MNHYTNKKGDNGITANQPWHFRASQPPGERPFGAYFTTLEPGTLRLASRLGIPKEKMEFVFVFADGRADVVLIGPLHVQAGDIILRACRRSWPAPRFQDVHEDALHELDEPWLWEYGTACQEFFVYRDVNAAKRWDELGAVEENSNTMLHFLTRDRTLDTVPITEVTCVCDARAGTVAEIIREIEMGLQFVMLDARGAA